jgi:abequosyltransferase
MGETHDTASIRLSICITSRNRADVIGTTLEDILPQCSTGVEVVVVDGASTDNSVAVVTEIAARYPQLRLLAMSGNSGLDADYDKAVQAARGTYCWLFTDDDLLAPGAVERVLKACSEDPLVVIVDASVHNADFTLVEKERQLPALGKVSYSEPESAEFFRECAWHLTFIGAVVVRRDFWLSRERARYYGSEFIHLGVLFQAPIPGKVIVIREPLVKIRHGVATWLKRWFEIWMYKWPRLVASFEWIDESVRREVQEPEPWTNWERLYWARTRGNYQWRHFRELVVPRARHAGQLGMPLAFLLIPRVILERFREGRTLDRLRLRLQRQLRAQPTK